MSRCMYRYPIWIDDKAHAFMLSGDPVAVAGVGSYVDFWAEHDDDGSAIKRWFQVFGTGQPLPDGARHIGTCQRSELGLVWHLYEVGGAS